MNQSPSRIIDNLFRTIAEFRKYDPQLPIQTAAVFLTVAARPGITMLDIGKKLNTSQASCSRNVSALSKWRRQGSPGLDVVVAKEDPAERRRKQVWLTPKGEDLLRSILDIYSVDDHQPPMREGPIMVRANSIAEPEAAH
ncbi:MULTISPECIES: MarR family winged helix-turn-helix transcriptional regulator [unclassified Thioalkalivibrio]|uniref:MarR family winged helix-turn-helix transcriptional regulator n=1 Tax=unclassified Thioalkalivibrio TaxID=2621013 RepID=UPI000366A94F|nr:MULTISPECIES: MarR family winged helix-turn-helix transcriptional regulator [unclassified Thioalkalivibrio]